MLSRRDFLKLCSTAALAGVLPRMNLLDAISSSAAVIYHGSRTYHKLALTFDDCWHAELIEQLTGILQPYPDFHLTFFAVGDAILNDEIARPNIWKRLVQGGHEIGYHTMHHFDPKTMSSASLLADFDEWMGVLHRVLGFDLPVHFARPPGDDLSPSWLDLCRQRSLVATMFSIGFEAPNIIDSMLYASRVLNGDIIQMHTYQDPLNGRFDVDITEHTVPYLAAKRFTLVTMSQLYDDLIREQNSSPGCNLGDGIALTRSCFDQ